MTLNRWSRLLPLVCIILLTLLFFHRLAFSGKILARGDTLQYFYPYWDARNEAYRAGELPLWSPELFLGVPLLANPQLGVYYPLNWLTAPWRAPTAISLSILLHTALAGLGAVWLYRLTISENRLAGLLAGIVYAFGGAVSAHVEQINQLQGLAWMPLLFALFHLLLTGGRRARFGFLLAVAWAMQILSGHTQTVFISGVGLTIYGVGWRLARSRRIEIPRLAQTFLMLALSFAGALLLALPQLLPSFELMQLSNRGGGFSLQEATAFSLPPNLVGRAVLPSYDGQFFSEYVATLGIIGLGLALWGALARRRNGEQRWIWLLLAGCGLALALGRYNPLYLLLGELPGFNLFRVPARFLALFSLALALLAGRGLEALTERSGSRRPLLLVAGGTGLLILLTRFVMPLQEGLLFSISAMVGDSLPLWLGAWLLLLALLLLRGRWWIPVAAAALVTGELFLAAANLPYNDLSPPDVYLDQRIPVSQLLAWQAAETAPGRVISASQIYFDPEDITALRERYASMGMDAAAQFHALDAVKMGETVMPNLPLTWGIPSLDGFGGGVTPTRYYSLYASLLLPRDAPPLVDGRIGERLAVPICHGACLPDRRWLDATDTRYLITDKVYDIPHQGIVYDTALARYWADAVETPALPDHVDEVRILHRAPLAWDKPAEALARGYLLTTIDGAALPDILAVAEGILALSAVDSAQPAVYEQLQPPPFERVYSGAVKIFRLPAAGQRAFLAEAIGAVPDGAAGDEAARQMLREGAPVVIHGAATAQAVALDGSQAVDILEYDQGRISLAVTSPEATMLVLAEAWYPGWRAEVNGEAAPILRANLMFRAIPVPAGESQVTLAFEPQMWRAALYIGVILWLITFAIALAGAIGEIKQRRQPRPQGD